MITYEKIFQSWTPFMRRSGIDGLMDELLLNLTILYELTIVYPEKNKVMRAFRETPIDSCNVVFLGQDPYHNVYKGFPSACGIAFMTENGYINPSLKNILDEVEEDVGLGEGPRDPSRLLTWCHQGVLMLNTSLTVEKGKSGSHHKVWKTFSETLISNLSRERPDLIWVLLGTKARDYKKHIACPECPSPILVESAHPSPLAVGFRGSKIYSRVNNELIKQGKEKIIW